MASDFLPAHPDALEHDPSASDGALQRRLLTLLLAATAMMGLALGVSALVKDALGSATRLSLVREAKPARTAAVNASDLSFPGALRDAAPEARLGDGDQEAATVSDWRRGIPSAPEAGARAKTSAAPAALTEAGPEGGTYSVQVMSFRALGPARELQSALTDRGFAAYVTEVDLADRGRFFRVRVGAYRSRFAATQAMKTLEHQEKLPGFVVENVAAAR